jgi:hypothetical protein
MVPTWKTAAESLVTDLRNVFGHRLQSVVAYGPLLEGATDAPLSCLALVATLTAEDLQACAHFAGRWERSRVATPLILTGQEFMRSLDTFPLEYGEIIRTHERVYGEDPFSGATIAPDDLRRACELQAKSHLLHLREAYIETGGRPAAIARLVTGSAAGFTSLLRNVARLNGVLTNNRVEVTRAGAHAVGIPDGLVSDMLSLEHHSGVLAVDSSRLFPDYLGAVEQLARAVDGWRT